MIGWALLALVVLLAAWCAGCIWAGKAGRFIQRIGWALAGLSGNPARIQAAADEALAVWEGRAC